MVTIEDLSGNQSCWKFVADTSVAVTPQDNVIRLPNQDHVWSTMNAASREYKHMLPNKAGYLAWGGAQDLSDMDLSTNVLDHKLGNDFIVGDIHTVELQFTNQDKPFSVLVPMTSTAATGVPAEGLVAYPSTDLSVQTTIRVKFSKNTDGQLVLSVTPSRHPSGDLSALRHVIAHTR